MNQNYQEMDMRKKPQTHVTPLYCVAEGLSFVLAAFYNHKLFKSDEVKKLKGPYIVLANHASFTDFVDQFKSFHNRKMCWVVSIEEFYNNGEWVMRTLGCYPKRKFVPDVINVMHMMNILKKGKVLCIYPEVRFSFAGINERLDKALGKFIKKANVPVVLQMNYGNWIQSPQYNKHPLTHPKLKTEVKLLISKEDLEKLSAEEIQQKIEDNFKYNEYEYQQLEGFKIKSKTRLNNVHKILYKCPHCGAEFEMEGKGIELICHHCNNVYQQDEYGTLHNLNGETKFKCIQDWYKWEREEVEKEVRSGKYHFEDEVIFKQLFKPSVGWIKLGKMKFIHDYDGMHVIGTKDDGEYFEFHRGVDQLPSVHIEFNEKDKKDKKNAGSAIDFANKNETYFGWLIHQKNALVKIHFATESMHDMYLESLKKNSK